MIVYAGCIRNQKRQWLKILTHKRLAKEKEELERVRPHYPEAFVSSVWYIPLADGSLWRRPLQAIDLTCLETANS